MQTPTSTELFGKTPIPTLLSNPDFKEDSVREVLILPILSRLGYSNNEIVRSKQLEHPFIKVGSKSRPIKIVPDYLLKVENNFAWVLDAKSPNEKIVDSEHVEQVYSYASHPEIRSTFFALCNGREFVVYRRESDSTPVLQLSLDEIHYHWDELAKFLSPTSFQVGKIYTYDNTAAGGEPPTTFQYSRRPLLDEIPVHKQKAKRHFGVHGYFTKQAWNVVADYIKNYSKPGDLVLDPFGGSGVTVVEALMNNRKGISIDLNPMAVFLTDALMVPVEPESLSEAYSRVKDKYHKLEPKNNEEIQQVLKQYEHPKGIRLPKDADVDYIEELFTEEQLAKLSLLKSIILEESDINIQKSLLLMFSGLLTKSNLTYHTTPGKPKPGQGDAAAFRYYRYRVAPRPVGIDIPYYFELRYKKVLAAKKEMAYNINPQTILNGQVVRGTAVDLKWISTESVDYIYTDPPYGKKIPYLDVSAMWNAWLDFEITAEDYNAEAIIGGDHKKSKEEYNNLISLSIKEMYRVLKFDRWMSFVFAHKDPEFWHLIVETAENCGFQYVGAVAQKNGQSSFKKRQNPFTVLSGQLIINFRKVQNPKAILRAHLGINTMDIIMETIESVIAKNNGATIEQINDELIVKGLELGFLDLLKNEYADIARLLKEKFDFDNEQEVYTLNLESKFRTQIDERLRIKYYLLSFLRRKEMESYKPTFDEIVLNILPLLRNGTTPENQTILKVLEDVADHVGKKRWRIQPHGQTSIF